MMHATDAHNLLLRNSPRTFSASESLAITAQLIDTLGYFVREFHFAARVEHDLPAVFFESHRWTPSSRCFRSSCSFT